MKIRVRSLIVVLIVGLASFPAALADGPPVEWEKTFGGSSDDYGYSVQQTTDGGYIIAGETMSFGAGYQDVYLVKADPNGNLLWQKTFGGSESDIGRSVQQTTDGGYIITGFSGPFACLIKTDPNGNLQWQKTFGGTGEASGYSVQQTSDGGFIIAGETSFSFAEYCDVYLIKTDSQGNLLWQKTFGGIYPDRGNSVRQTTDGGFIIAGDTADEWDDAVYLIKTDSAGNLQWQKTFGGIYQDYAYSVQQTTDGGYIIAGETQSFGAGYYDVYLIKTNPTGNLQWQKTFGGSDLDVGYSVQQTTDGGYITAGVTASFGAGHQDIYLIKTDSTGNLQWQKTVGGSGYESSFSTSIQQTSDAGFIIAGDTWSFGAGGWDVYLIKLSSVRFEINQCFQEVDDVDGHTQKYELIETKPFAARVTLENYPPGEIKVKLSVFNVASGKQIGTTKEKTIKIKHVPAKTLDFLFSDDETKNMKAGNYRFSLVVEDSKGNKLLEPNFTYKFKSSKTVRMLVPKLICNKKKASWNNDYVEFVGQVFPVPKTAARDVNHLEIVRSPSTRFSGNPATQWDLLFKQMENLLNSYNISHPLDANFICAIVPDGTFNGKWDGVRLGRAIVVEAQNESKYILGHEAGHIYGLGEEYVDSNRADATYPNLWLLDQRFEFGPNMPCNPPPLKLDPTGPFIIAAGRPNARECCNWANDTSSYQYPPWYFYDANGVCQRVWCTGRYVGEGGYDVKEEVGVEVSPKTFTMMSGIGSPRWVSGPEYKTLINKLVPPSGTSQVAQPASGGLETLSSSENRVIVSGIINTAEATAEISPLIPAPNLEPTPEANESDFSLVFLSSSRIVLGTFTFAPLESEYINTKRPFSVIIDLPFDPETAIIQVVISGIVGAELRLTDNSPTVKLLSPNGGERILEQLPIVWSASDLDRDQLKYTIEFSNNNGNEWHTLAIDHEVNELTVDSNDLPGGDNCLVKVIASDGWNRSEDKSDDTFFIVTKPPEVSIFRQACLAAFTNMQGRCTAYDPETGDIIDPNAIVWSSNVDGILGKGDLIGFELSLGDHLLSVTVTDPEGKTATDTVNVTVVAYRPDFNRDQRVNFFDWAKLANMWLMSCSEPSWCEGIDLNFSGQVEFGDLAIFAENWLEGTTP